MEPKNKLIIFIQLQIGLSCLLLEIIFMVVLQFVFFLKRRSSLITKHSAYGNNAFVNEPRHVISNNVLF